MNAKLKHDIYKTNIWFGTPQGLPYKNLLTMIYFKVYLN